MTFDYSAKQMMKQKHEQKYVSHCIVVSVIR